MSSVLPDTIGRFKILQSLGSGGMGAIYLARDPDLGSLVAIKVLTEVQSEELRQRFLREAKATRLLRHTNIVTVYETGIADGMPYIVMEYIQGETLEAIIKRGKKGGVIGIDRKLQIMDEICAGLDYAHRKHVVHRDIKPANIMIDEEGVLRILDFGIARLGAGGGMTQAGQVMGTVNYMPPEQWRGAQVDHRADIFSAGALFYELLSYEKAFPGKELTAIMHRIINEAPEPLDRFCPDLDASVIAVVNRCLAKDAKDRYPDFGEVRSAFAAAKAGALNSGGTKTATGSGPVDREKLLRMRAEQIERQLEAARRALETSDYTRVRQACQQALILQPDHAEAIELDERAAAAIEQQQLIRKWLSEANAELQRGGVTQASILVDRALSINPESPDALAIRDAVDAERRRLAEAEAHERALDEALGEARYYLEAGAFDDAIDSIEKALRVEPDNQAARQLRADVDAAHAEKRRADAEALAARQRAAAEAPAARQPADTEAQARAAIAQARQRFAAGDRAAGIEALARFQPAALVAQTLAELRGELRESERRERDDDRTVLSGTAPNVLGGKAAPRTPTPAGADDRTVLSGTAPNILGKEIVPRAPAPDGDAGRTVLSGTASNILGSETVLRAPEPAGSADQTVLRGTAPNVFGGETVMRAPAAPDVSADRTVLRGTASDLLGNETVLRSPVPETKAPKPSKPAKSPKPAAVPEPVARPEPAHVDQRREEKRPFPMAIVAGGGVLVVVAALAFFLWPKVPVSSPDAGTKTDAGATGGSQPGANAVALPPAAPPADLTVESRHSGAFSRGQAGATYTLRVNNRGGTTTSGEVTITDRLPGGLKPSSAKGDGWNCRIAGQVVTCTRLDSARAGAGYPDVTVTVGVATNAALVLNNSVSVSGGGERDLSNDAFTDQTEIAPEAGAKGASAAEIANAKKAADAEAEALRVKEAEAAKVREAEAAKIREAEAAKLREAEAAKTREAEAAKTREAEAAKAREAEAAKARETEAARTRDAEAAKTREAEAAKVKEAEAAKAREAEAAKKKSDDAVAAAAAAEAERNKVNPAVVDMEAVTGALQQFADGFKNKDGNRIKAVYPSFPLGDFTALNAKLVSRDYKIDLSSGGIRFTNPARTAAKVSATVTSSQVGIDPKLSFKGTPAGVTISLEKKNGSWIITEIK